MKTNSFDEDYSSLWQQLATIEKRKSRTLERKIVQSGSAWVNAALLCFESAQPPLRGRLCRLLGQLVELYPQKIYEFLRRAVDDHDLKTRCNAISSFRKDTFLKYPEVEFILLEKWLHST